MKIGFLSLLNPFDIRYWSGTLYHFTQKLSNHQLDWYGEGIFEQLCSYRSLSSKPFCLEHYSDFLGSILSERLKNIDADVLIVRDNSLVASLKVSCPIVFLGDATINGMKEYFDISKDEDIELVDRVEKQFLLNTSVIIYSSDWAAQDAMNYYGIPASKIHVVEFGANIPHPDEYQVEIDTSVCDLVFIGTNWEKKGGEKVLETFNKLKSEGFPCSLTVIGSVPPKLPEDNKDLTIIPFLDKSKAEDLERLCDILYHAHFLVLPTEFDAFGIVFCEASAYGVPSIAADLGGVSQPIREGANGFLLPPTATAEDYAEKIKSVFKDKKSYMVLRESSRREYETRLNWNVWGKKVNKILEETVRNY